MIVVGLVSSFREGPMLATALRSLEALEHVCVFEGPVEGNVPSGPVSELIKRPGLFFSEGVWETDAAKRTAMVEWCRRRWPGKPVWGLWLDGDELLLWGEYLGDWLWRVSQQGDDANPVAGWPFPLVELDGSVAICMGKLVRVDLIRRYLVSSSYIEMMDGSRRTVGNTKVYSISEGPLVENWRARPPLAGEPHLQHRPVLRSKLREVERQHRAEDRNYRGRVLKNGS
jgi:hypothetical protein